MIKAISRPWAVLVWDLELFSSGSSRRKGPCWNHPLPNIHQVTMALRSKGNLYNLLLYTFNTDSYSKRKGESMTSLLNWVEKCFNCNEVKLGEMWECAACPVQLDLNVAGTSVAAKTVAATCPSSVLCFLGSEAVFASSGFLLLDNESQFSNLVFFFTPWAFELW